MHIKIQEQEDNLKKSIDAINASHRSNKEKNVVVSNNQYDLLNAAALLKEVLKQNVHNTISTNQA